MDSFKDAWLIVSEYCRTKITDIAYKTWIVRIKPVSLDYNNGKVVLLVPNDFHRQTLIRNYLSLFNEAFEAVFSTTFELCFVTEEEQKKEEEETGIEVVNSDYEYTFENFIVGSSNKFAHAASLAVAANPAGAYNPLFLYGNSGLGKTHLLYAIGNDIKKSNPDMKIIYVKGDDFANELIESIRQNTTVEFRHKYRQADVLLVDDVQFIGGKEATQEEFFHTFNTLFEGKKQIVLTSDRPPKDINVLEERLRSRFEWGLLADVQPPDMETRIAIIKRKAEYLDLPMSNEVAEFIAQKLKNNIRQLEGTVKKLKARYMLNNEKPTILIVSEVISDILNNNVSPEHTIEKIVEEVARTFGVTPEDITTQKSRKASINLPRHIAIYISRELTTLTMENIGEKFGGKHYSTIVYNIQQMEKKMKTDSKLKETVQDIMKNIRGER